jgi:hypothetical protein
VLNTPSVLLLSSFICHKHHIKQTCKQCDLDRLKSGGHQRDANLCNACAHPTDERSVVRGGGGYNQGSYVYFAKRCGGWVFAGVNGVICVDVEGNSVLGIRPGVHARQAGL